MAEDTSLLLRIKGDAAGGKAAVAETRAAIATLRSTAGTEFKAMENASKGAFEEIGKHLNFFVGERIPLFGGAFIKVTENIKDMGAEAENAGGSLAALGGIGGVVTLGLIAMAAAAVGVGFAIFEITKKSAEVGLELEHLIEQTGLTAKTITSLKFASDESGKSIEGFDRGMKIFENTVAKAALGSNEAAAALTRLGIKPKEALQDLDGALAKVFKKIYDAPSGVEKVSLASDAFGKRMGSNLIPLIESFHGNLGELIKRAEELGVTLDEQGIHALADFQRNMNALGAQALGLERIFAVEVAPAITQALQDLSRYLASNREAFHQWGAEVGDVLRGIRKITDSEVGTVVAWLARLNFELTGIPAGVRAIRALGAQTPASQQDQDLLRMINSPLGRARTPGALELGLGGGGKGGGGAGKAARDPLADALKEAALIEKETLQLIAANVTENKRALDEQIRDIEDFTKRAKELSDERLNAVIDQVNSEYEAYRAALARKKITQAEFDNHDRELTVKTNEAVLKNSEEVFQLEQERDRKISEAQIAAKQREIQIAEDADQRTIERIKDRVDRSVLLESEGEKQIGEIIDEGFARRKKALEEEDTAYSTSLERRKDINAELIRLDGDRAASAEETTKRILKAQFDEQNALARNASRKRKTTDVDQVSSIDQLFEAINRGLTGGTQTAALAGLQAMTTAFEGLGQAVGQVVESFVLYGSAGTSVRKVTAEILAGIAKQAAIKAIFELAEGFAALAMAFFGIPNAGPSATAHFTAAAIYGGIAGVAALAGRAVAGNSFAPQSATGSTASGGSRSTSPTTPATKEVNRTGGNFQAQTIVHELIFRVKGDAVVDHFIRDYDLNGRTRIKILSDGQS